LLYITLYIRDPNIDDQPSPLQRPPQEALIIPFAILKGLAGLNVKCLDSKPAQKTLKKATKKPNSTAGDYLESAASLKDEGNAAFKEGKFRSSIKHYLQTYEAMHFIVDGKRFAIMLDGYFVTALLVCGRFDGRREDLIRHKLGSQLSWNLIQAYLKLET